MIHNQRPACASKGNRGEATELLHPQFDEQVFATAVTAGVATHSHHVKDNAITFGPSFGDAGIAPAVVSL